MMKGKLPIIFVLLIFGLISGTVTAQVPDDFYKNGFPQSSGRYELGVKGLRHIEFFRETSYFDNPYDIKATFPFEKVPECNITKIQVNGDEIKDFVIFNNYIYSRFKKANGTDDLVITCISNWEFDKVYTIKAFGKTPDGKNVSFSVSAAAPKKDVEFNYPDDRFGSKYISVFFKKGELKNLRIQDVLINGLVLKNFKAEKDKIYLPVNWSVNTRYDVEIKSDKKSVFFKLLGPPVQMSFGYPNVNFHFYNLTYTFDKNEYSAFEVKEVFVNGEETRDFIMTDDGESLYDKKVTGNNNLSMTVSCSWEKGKWYTLTVKGVDDKNREVKLNAKGLAGGGFGYWDTDWKHYAAVVVKETAGIERSMEPVHLKMALYSDRLIDPEKEIRVIEVNSRMRNSKTGFYREIPSQVYNIHEWNNKDLIGKVEKDETSGEKIIRYLPTTTLEVAFNVDIHPYSEKIYLIFYGNPHAVKPSYKTDLKISGSEIGQVIDNDFYTFDLDDNSGAFFSVFLKQGRNVTLEHKLETNGAVHWNPGVYSPPHAWVHASDWQKPEFEQVSGPIFHMTKRHAMMPHMDNVKVMITYVFYAGKPYVLTTSLTEVLEEIHVKALRNGEIVFNHEQLNEFVYKSKMGDIKTLPIEGSKPHPAHAIRIPYDTPWLAFVNRDKKIGFGGVLLGLANTNRFGGLSDAEQPYIYVANGPWIYFSRALNYSFGSNNPSRMIRTKKGSMYFEETVYVPFILGDRPDTEFKLMEDLSRQLNHPLEVMYYLDTDRRNNKGWVVPILVEPFDEGVKGAVGGEKKKK